MQGTVGTRVWSCYSSYAPGDKLHDIFNPCTAVPYTLFPEVISFKLYIMHVQAAMFNRFVTHSLSVMLATEQAEVLGNGSHTSESTAFKPIHLRKEKMVSPILSQSLTARFKCTMLSSSG